MRRSHPLTRRQFLAAAVSTLSAGAVAVLAACSGPEAGRPDDPFELGATSTPARAANQPSPTGRATGTPRQTQGIIPTKTTTAGATGSPASVAGNDAAATATTGDGAATPTPTGRPTIAIDPSVPPSLLGQARRIQQQLVEELGGVATDGEGDLRILYTANDTPALNDTATATVEYVAVVSRRLLVRDITFDQLTAIWHGEIDDWAEVGSPVPHGVVRVTVQGSAGPFPIDNVAGDFPTIEDLAVYLLNERGAIAILPIGDVDFRMRTLNIDGINFFRPNGAPNPLRATFHIRPRRSTVATATATATQTLAGRASTILTPPSVPTPVSMTWAGDIIIARQVQRRINELGDWAAPFRAIYPELTWADITIANLETSLSDSFETNLDPTTFDFKTYPPAIEGLQLAQIDVLSRANNHSFNYGPIGMNDTTAVLDAAGIKHFGMGNNLEEARRAVVVELGGTSYAFLGYNGISDDWDGAGPDWPGTMPMVDWMVVEDIKRELGRGHVVIPFFHWGIEYVYDPSEEQRYFAHVAIDSGASLVMGSHPHWIQGVETYKGVPIVYSLGNFIFDQEWSWETKVGMLAHIWMQGAKVLKIDLAPILIEDYHRPRLMTPAEQWPELEHIWAASDRIIRGG
jgi:poly-gamma-glutamate capsule biosynthesis protein CapA/YwtB (metallophosphatase superfamily)